MIQIGIHTVFVIEILVTKERLDLEFTALCVLSEISSAFLSKYGDIYATRESRSKTPSSFVVVVSLSAFKMYQCFAIGLKLVQNVYSAEIKTLGTHRLRETKKGWQIYPDGLQMFSRRTT